MSRRAPNRESRVSGEFQGEFETVRAAWLRKRFLVYAAIAAGVAAIVLLSNIAIHSGGDDKRGQIALSATRLFIFIFGFCLAWLRPLSRPALYRLVYWMVVLPGVISSLAAPMIIREAGSLLGVADAAQEFSQSVGQPVAILVLFNHLLASMFIPWTPREAVSPLIPLIAVFGAVVLIFGEADLWARIFVVAFSPFLGAPGVFISWWRHSRFQDQFMLRALHGRYGEMKRELTDAQRLHESFLPAPIDDGPVRFSYTYEPMRSIGGDFVFTHVAPSGRVSIALIDVTGHGIQAALAVNRLHGELERLYNETPEAGPDDAMVELNRHLHYSMSNHGVFATAWCGRVDPDSGVLEYVSGGHPPAIVRRRNGQTERLDSTTFLLGVLRPDEFEAAASTTSLGPGEAVVAYTDGAIEARTADGRMIGIGGLEAMLRDGGDDALPERVLAEVRSRRAGPAEDDTLIAELRRP